MGPKMICGVEVLVRQCMPFKGQPKSAEGTHTYVAIHNDYKMYCYIKST